MLMPYGSKHNQRIVAKVGIEKKTTLLPYGSARNGDLVAKAGTVKMSDMPQPRDRHVVRLTARG